MMTTKRILTIAGSLALAGALFYFYGGHQTPDGQLPLAELNSGNFASLGEAFNAAEGEVRVILMFSPT